MKFLDGFFRIRAKENTKYFASNSKFYLEGKIGGGRVVGHGPIAVRPECDGN